MSDYLDKLERLFRAAQMHDSDERKAFIDAACEGNEEMKEELLSLLKAYDEAERESFLEDSPILPTGNIRTKHQEDSPLELRGKTVGPYSIVKTLGRGEWEMSTWNRRSGRSSVS